MNMSVLKKVLYKEAFLGLGTISAALCIGSIYIKSDLLIFLTAGLTLFCFGAHVFYLKLDSYFADKIKKQDSYTKALRKQKSRTKLKLIKGYKK